MPYAIGIDLGGTNVKVGLVERGRGLVEELAFPTEAEKGPGHIVERLASAAATMRERAPGEVAGVGIGSPGVLNWERTTVSHPPNFPGWREVNLRDEIQQRVKNDLLVFVENDANVAALGSAHYGAGQPHDNFVMLTLGTGVGGAIIYHNRIFRGATGGAGEIGHMTIDYEGPFARSGVAGAAEAYLGQRFLSKHAYDRLLHTDSLVHEMTGDNLEGLSPKTLSEAAQQGDEPAREMLAWAGHKLGVLMGSVVNLLDIRKFIVGGGVSAAGDLILEPARQILPRYVQPGMREDLEVIHETLGNEAGMLGAAYLVFEALDEAVDVEPVP